MRDPLTWSLPVGRLFGIAIRVHVFFPVVALGMVLHVAFDPKSTGPNLWLDAVWLVAILFASVLIHELGHCFGARIVEGDAHEILLWPLGGLASLDVPHTPRAQFIATVAGPVANFLVCLCMAAILLAGAFTVWPLLSPWWEALTPELYSWAEKRTYHSASTAEPQLGFWQILIARIFWVNWLLGILNIVLVGYPMDGGRLFHCLLWPRFGFRQAMIASVWAGIFVSLILAVYAIAWTGGWLFGFLALFIFFTCRQQYIILEGGGEESLFGYDFSQGYTSLERDNAPSPRRRRPSVWQRWQMHRAARKLQQELEQREMEERRMDELLEKVQKQGLHALNDEERRFLTRVSAKYRNRQ
jgi:Zn-dependent protease